MTANDPGDYHSPVRAQQYLNRAASLPHRGEGEAVLLELLTPGPRRVLDLGCGGGRLLALVLAVPPPRGPGRLPGFFAAHAGRSRPAVRR